MPYRYALYVCLICVPYMCAIYVCLICSDIDGAEYMYKRALAADANHALTLASYARLLRDERFVCLICVPYMCASYVCLTCVPYMCALYLSPATPVCRVVSGL